MAKWTAFPYDTAAYSYAPSTLAAHWPRLHAGDAEPLPQDSALLAAWALFHAGDFQGAFEAGLAAAAAGLAGGTTVANKAQSVHATYLLTSESDKLAVFLEVAERALAQQAREPRNANAYFWHAHGIGRYGQGISVGKAMAQGLGIKVKTALETAIRLEPRHADAHVALGAFHAEVIDKVGKLLARTQGADAATGLRMYQQALQINPGSAIARVEYANGLLMLEGSRRAQEADRLYAEAAAITPMDAMERLDVEMARAELAD